MNQSTDNGAAMPECQDGAAVNTFFSPHGLEKTILTVIIDDGLIYCDESLLSAAEKQQASLKHDSVVYRNWFFSRLAAKNAAAHLWNLNTASLEILNRSGGAPEIFADRNNHGKKLGHISISHCPGASAAAASNEAVGIDMEKADRHLKHGVVRWSFSSDELMIAVQDSGADIWPRHLALWCAKEAAGKCWGVGLLNHLNKIRVKQADWDNATAIVGWLDDAMQESIVRFIKYKDYLIALATL